MKKFVIRSINAGNIQPKTLATNARKSPSLAVTLQNFGQTKKEKNGQNRGGVQGDGGRHEMLRLEAEHDKNEVNDGDNFCEAPSNK
jgi:hypothetical protein